MSVGTVFTVLSHIPWDTVVKNAPKLAKGAASLWDKAKGMRKAGPKVPAQQAGTAAAPGTADVEVLRLQVEELQATVLALQEQLQGCAEMVKELAEQNAELVTRVEHSRSRTRTLTIGLVLCAAVCAALAYAVWA